MLDGRGAGSVSVSSSGSSTWGIGVTVILLTLVSIIFFRSILPRLPRFFLRGRLRVKRVGLRGVRGIEWRSNGFKRPKPAAFDDGNISLDDEDDEDVETEAGRGFALKVRRVWLDFHSSKEDDRSADTQHDGKSRSEAQKSCTSRISRAWITVRVEGVGITLPRQEVKKVDTEKEMQQREDQLRAAKEAEEREIQAQEARLAFLMQSRPSSPALGSSSPSRGSRSASPMPAFSTAMEQMEQHASLQEPASWQQQMQSYWTLLVSCSRHIKEVVLPAVWLSAVNVLRSLAYFLTSCLPFLTSIVDVEVTRVEIYHKQAEAVIRLESIGLDLSMSLIQTEQTGDKPQASVSPSAKCRSFSKRFSEMISSMPDRIGSRAKGAASFVTDGLPGGRISLRLTTTGIQVFEATLARRSRQTASKPATKDSMPSTPAPQAYSFDTQPLHFSPENRQTSSGHGEWHSFSAVSSPTAPLKRSKSVINVTGPAPANDRGVQRWADWALEVHPNADFSPQTGWRRDSDKGKGRVIHPSARILSMPDRSSFKVGLVLGGNSNVSSKESIHMAVDLSEAYVGVDAVMKVLSSLEKHKTARKEAESVEEGDQIVQARLAEHRKRQRPKALGFFLEQLGSASFTWPSLTLIMSSKLALSSLASLDDAPGDELQSHLPSSVQLQAEVRTISFSIKTSDPADEMHQRWLGTCGIKGFRSPKNVKAFTDHFRWNPHREKIRYIEHRRAFHIEAGIAGMHVRVGVDGEKQSIQSELLSTNDIALRIRSTWTPIGLLISAKESALDARRFFQGDPNEQSLVVELSANKVAGDLKARHASSLLAFIRKRLAERKDMTKKRNQTEGAPTRPAFHFENIPKFSIGLQIEDVSYRLDASELMQSPSIHRQRLQQDHELGLILAVPRINFAFHAGYVDQYVHRGEVERKAAWKSLANDELEWSLQDDTLGKIRQHQKQEGNAFPRSAGGEYADWQENSARQEAQDREDEERAEREELAQPEALTMREALLKMKELQDWEELQGKPNQRQAFNLKNKWKRFAKQRAALRDTCPHNTRLMFESQCTIDTVELFWAMSGEAISSRRKSRDDDTTRTTAASRVVDSDHLAKHHIFCLDSFAVCPTGSIPGFQSVESDRVRLDASKALLDVRSSMEEVDVDMWHPAAMLATKKILRHFSPDAPKEEGKRPDENVADGGAWPDEDALPPSTPKPTLIETIKDGISAYVSIGSIIAHVAGVDERCDGRMSRGVGFEAKRAVFELACYCNEYRRPADLLKLALGARSTLDLPEDMRSSCNALATKYGKGAMAKLSLYEIGLFPLLDADQATAQHLKRGHNYSEADDQGEQAGLASPSIIAPAVWEFQKTRPQTTSKKRTQSKFRQQDRSNFIFWMPFSATKASLIPKGASRDKVSSRDEQLTVTVEGTRLLAFKVELLHTYCLLMAFAALKSILPERRLGKATPQKETRRGSKDRSAYESVTYSIFVNVDETHVSVSLPSDINLFLSVRRLEGKHSSAQGLSIGFESLMTAVESPQVPSKGLWDEAVRLRDFKVFTEPPQDGLPRKIIVNGDGAKMRVPFGYTVHPIIDNTVVAVKATKQLLHQFLTGKNDSIITPVAEDPKHLPIIRIRIRILSLEAQDDPFETRLNIIWRAGGDENQARAERDAAFQERASQMEDNKAGKVQSSGSTIASYTETISSFTDEENASNDGHAGSIGPSVSVEQARQALDAFNASSWIRRYTNAKAEQARREDLNLRKIYGRLPQVRQDSLPIKLTTPNKTSPLFRSTMSRLELEVSPTTFPEGKLRDFLYQQGQGMPKDLEYSLLVPMHLRMTMAEWKVSLRDYPLPLLHLPPTKAKAQPDHLPAWELKTDMCIGEQLGDQSALRHVTAIVVPAATGRPDAIEYGISVPKMAMPTKFFGSPVIDINSCYPTRLVWGQSLQPAIHDVVHVIEGITSPPHDPSPRVGFWDKLSLIFHGRVHFRFPKEGELHLYLKGSRDPYHILEHGSGWVKCWRGNVELKINFENEQREVFQMISNEYLLAIPDLKDYIDRAATGTDSGEERRDSHDSSEQANSNTESTLSSSGKRYMKEPEFKKICMRLTNGVRWGAGLHLERTCTERSCEADAKCKGQPFHRECRFWTRKPHWEVHTRTQEYKDSLQEGEFGDSYEGWRSDHLHFSISIYSTKGGPDDMGMTRDQSKSQAEEDAVNNLYFTPLAWEHFFAWMRLFNSALSLPIRQGKLFPGSLAQSPKFGRHLGTIKYRFDISPLFITHVYPQDDKADWARGITTLLGVKSRVSVFHFDLHQRQQEMLKERPELGETRKVFHKPFYEAEIDLAEIDLRTLAGQFIEPEKQLFTPDEYDDDSHQAQHDVIFGGPNDSKISDQDKEWYDVADFVELDWKPPSEERPPKIRLMQAMTCPRFNYYRRIESQRERRARTGQEDKDGSEDNEKKNGANEDGEGDESGYESDGMDRLEKSKFGREKTHSCLVGRAPSTVQIQVELASERIQCLKEEYRKAGEEDSQDDSIVIHPPTLDSDEQRRPKNGNPESTDKKQSMAAKDLGKKIRLIEEYVRMLQNIAKSETFGDSTEQDEAGRAAYSYFATPYRGGISSMLNLKAVYQEWDAFDNRYFAHNPTIFFSNATRDVLLKYYLSSRRRRGLVHSLSARAVRYIRDLSKPKNSEEKEGHGRHNFHHHHHNSHRLANRQRQENDTPQSNNSPAVDSPKSDSGSESASDGPELLRGLLRDTMQYIIPNDAEEQGYSAGGEEGAGRAGGHTQADTFDDEEVDPTYGISDEYEVRKSNVCVLLKPQIVLRSLVDDRSTMILTAIRSRMHNYSVKDPRAEEDSVNERALYRNYVAIDGLQAFHPSEHCSFLQRAKQRYGFLHVPLETLIDLKYETKDFDRIAPRTDASMHYDKFNKLRLQDASRPVAADLDSMDPAVDHLRHSMDLVRLRCPKFAVLANSEHFGAIYNIVTDLLLYRDPAYREYAKKLELMMLSYDLSDHDLLASVVQALQVRIRHAKGLHVQYQLHFHYLNEQGRVDFLSLKAELKEMIDELGLIMEAIKTEDDQSVSDKDKKSALRVEAQANDIAWNMMGHEEGELLAKLTIKGASFTWLNKADNSAANTLSITDLNAVNVRPDAVFTEIITKYNNVESHPMKKRGVLLNAIWSVLAPVGGIAIIDHLEIGLHPLRIQLEKSIGTQLEDYIFGSKREREKKDREQKQLEEATQPQSNGKKDSRLKRIANAMKGRDSHGKDEQDDKLEVNRATSGKRIPSTSERNGGNNNKAGAPLDKRRAELLRKSSRSLSAKSSSSDLRASKGGSTPQTIGHSEDAQSGESDSDETGQHAIAARNAVEMRNRASRNTTFVYAKVFETIFCLSYKGEKQKSITDLYDLVFRSPRLEYRNRTWAHADLLNHLKKDILRAAWRQRSTLLKGVIHHRRPRHQAVADNIRALRDAQLTRRVMSGGSASFSLLQSSSDSQRLPEAEKTSSKDEGQTSGRVESDSSRGQARESHGGGGGGAGGGKDYGIGKGVPSFQLSVDPPESSTAQDEREHEDVLQFMHEASDGDDNDNEDDNNEQKGRGAQEDVSEQDLTERNRGGQGLKFGQYIAKRLRGGRKSRSSSLATLQRQASASKTRTRGNFNSDGEEYDDHDAENGSHSSDGETDESDEETGDGDNTEEGGQDFSDELTRKEFEEASARLQRASGGGLPAEHASSSSDSRLFRRRGSRSFSPGAGTIDSPKSARSRLSILPSRLSSPSPTQSPPPELAAPTSAVGAAPPSSSSVSSSSPAAAQRRSSTNTAVASDHRSPRLGGVKIPTPSMPKLHAPWQSRKESDESLSTNVPQAASSPSQD